MFFSSEKIKRQAEDFKLAIVDAQHEFKITQEVIAGGCGVHQSTVAQWLNPQSDHHMPAFELPNLPDLIFGSALAQILKGKMIAIHAIKPNQIPDGSIEDELLKITSQIGDMAKRKELTEENIKILKRRSSDIKTILDSLNAELAAAEKKQ